MDIKINSKETIDLKDIGTIKRSNNYTLICFKEKKTSLKVFDVHKYLWDEILSSDNLEIALGIPETVPAGLTDNGVMGYTHTFNLKND